MSQQYLQTQSSTAHGDSVWKLAWTGRNQVISASADGGLRVWDPTNPSKPKYHIQHGNLAIVSLSVDPAGTMALTAGIDGTVRLTDLRTGKTVGKKETFKARTPTGKAIPAWQIALHPTGTSWASTGDGASIVLYEGLPPLPDVSHEIEEVDADVDMEGVEEGEGALPQTEEEVELEDLGECVKVIESGLGGGSTKGKFGMALCYSPDGTSLAASTESGHVFIVDLSTQSLVKTYSAHALPVRSLAWTPDSQFLFSGSDDRRIVLYDIKTGTETASEKGGSVKDVQGHKSWVLSLSVSQDGKTLVSGGADATVKIWDITDLNDIKQASSTNTGSQIWAVAFRPTEPILGQGAAIGKAFVSGGDDKRVAWWKSAGAA